MRSAAAATTLLVMAASAASCAGTSRGAVVTHPLAPSTVVEGAYADPLERIEYPPEEVAGPIQAAGEAAIDQCMSERGHDYLGGVFPWAVNYEQAQYVYGTTDPESARVNGLRSALWMDAERRAAEGDEEPSQDYIYALRGTESVAVSDSAGVTVAHYDPDSCLGRALDSVTPKWAEFEAARQMSGEVLLAAGEAARTDPAVLAGHRQWSECMARDGYDYADLSAMNSDFPGKSPTEAEIAVAIVSAACMHSSELLRTWSKARAARVAEGLGDYPDLLSTWDGLVEETLEGLDGES
jgi:hypothetical protein